MCVCVVYVHVDRTLQPNETRIRMAIMVSLCHDVMTTSHNLAYTSVQDSVCPCVHHEKGTFLYFDMM